MRIGLFSDSYLPSLDGISYSIESFRVALESMGHEVFVFAPAPSIRYKERTKNIIRFPAVKGLFYDDYLTSIFFPPQALQMIKNKKLDVIHFHTPSQIGLLGAYFALRNNVPLMATYHTDLYEYVSHYPQVLPGTIALSILAPFITRGGIGDLRSAISSIKPERNIDKWNKKMVVRGVTMLHNQCDRIIAPSRKIERQLKSWGTKAPIRILPTGVDEITTSHQGVISFKKRFGIKPHHQVVMFAGRLGSEKNIELLLSAAAILAHTNSDLVVLLVGRHEHQGKLAAMAHELGIADRVIFTGYVSHERLGAAYASADVFAFPSRTDTQGLVIHEAASAGLPIVMIDKEITEIVKNGVNGYIARNSARDFAKKIGLILEDNDKRKAMGKASIKLAAKYSVDHQAHELEHLYENVLKGYAAAGRKPKA
ncbi:MAG TPA: glycosyltransferase [Candidatus Saccharimonadales bacterium]|nr:glycosyltransferase [Candidatus Saccharimonadales bacterium]